MATLDKYQKGDYVYVADGKNTRGEVTCVDHRQGFLVFNNEASETNQKRVPVFVLRHWEKRGIIHHDERRRDSKSEAP